MIHPAPRALINLFVFAALLALAGCFKAVETDTAIISPSVGSQDLGHNERRLGRNSIDISEDVSRIISYRPIENNALDYNNSGIILVFDVGLVDGGYSDIWKHPVEENCEIGGIGLSPSADFYVYSCALFSSGYITEFSICVIETQNCTPFFVRRGGSVSPVFVSDDELLVFVFGEELILSSEALSEMEASQRSADGLSSFGTPVTISVDHVLSVDPLKIDGREMKGREYSFLHPLPVDRIAGGSVLVKHLALVGGPEGDQRANDTPSNWDSFGLRFAELSRDVLSTGLRIQPLAVDRVDWIAPNGGVLALNEDANGFVGETAGQLNAELGLLEGGARDNAGSVLEFFDFSGRFFALGAISQNGETSITVCEFGTIWVCGEKYQVGLEG